MQKPQVLKSALETSQMWKQGHIMTWYYLSCFGMSIYDFVSNCNVSLLVSCFGQPLCEQMELRILPRVRGQELMYAAASIACKRTAKMFPGHICMVCSRTCLQQSAMGQNTWPYWRDGWNKLANLVYCWYWQQYTSPKLSLPQCEYLIQVTVKARFTVYVVTLWPAMRWLQLWENVFPQWHSIREMWHCFCWVHLKSERRIEGIRTRLG